MTTAADTPISLLAARWKTGVPAHVTAEAAAIDAEACGELECGHCGRTGLGYWPLTRGTRYRAFATCDACGFSEEV